VAPLSATAWLLSLPQRGASLCHSMAPLSATAWHLWAAAVPHGGYVQAAMGQQLSRVMRLCRWPSAAGNSALSLFPCDLCLLLHMAWPAVPAHGPCVRVAVLQGGAHL